jgi:hypothetical protein
MVGWALESKRLDFGEQLASGVRAVTLPNAYLLSRRRSSSLDRRFPGTASVSAAAKHGSVASSPTQKGPILPVASILFPPHIPRI